MKKFEFRLETVLDITERQKKEAGELYAMHLNRQRQAESELKVLQEKEREIEAALIDLTHEPPFPLDKHALYTAYLPVLKKKQENKIIEIEERTKETEMARQILVKISRELKTLEKLKAKDYEEYMIEYFREEQKQLDDSAGVAYIRKTRSDSVESENGTTN